MYSRILVPIDGSETAAAAADHAIQLALAFDAEIHPIYVVETNVGPTTGLVDVLEALESAGEETVEAVRERASAAGVTRVDGGVLRGTPHRTILDYADENDVDLIVMGTHGRTGLDRYLLGSITERVVRMADVPVLTVRRDDTGDD